MLMQVDNRMRAWYQKDMSTGLLYICSLGRLLPVKVLPAESSYNCTVTRKLIKALLQAPGGSACDSFS